MSIVDLKDVSRPNQTDQYSITPRELAQFPKRCCSYCGTTLRRVCVFWSSNVIGNQDLLLHPECAVQVAAKFTDHPLTMMHIAADAYIAESIEKKMPILRGVVPSLQLWARTNCPSIMQSDSDELETPYWFDRRDVTTVPSSNPGWIYVLSNEGYPHLVKIGRTRADPGDRAAAMQSTGVPQPFVVEHKVHVGDCVALEAAVHKRLRHLRVNPKREFFRVSVSEAIKHVTEAAADA